MNIIKQKIEFLNTTLDYVPKQIQELYRFGFAVLTFKNIVSLRANSRLYDLNWNTAKSKIYRVTSNKKIQKVFPTLIKELNIVRKKDLISVDFSDFRNFQVLMFAKQTEKGRSIPVYFEILTYPIQKNSQNSFVIKSIGNFVNVVGFKPKLVFDRGFACPSIIKYLTKKRHKFIIRIKKSKKVIDPETKEVFKVQNSKKKDVEIIAYENDLRVVISDKKENMKEPWYLITNDFKTKRKNIIKQYYYRFEIEEFFRDAKRLL